MTVFRLSKTLVEVESSRRFIKTIHKEFRGGKIMVTVTEVSSRIELAL